MKNILIFGIITLFISMGIQPTLSSTSEDTNAPETTIQLTPETPDGENDWYVSPVTVSLVAIDNMSGVKDTYISINSESWIIYDSSFTLVDDRVYNIVYFSIDNAGNMEFPKLKYIKLEQQDPLIIKFKYKAIGDPQNGYDLIFTAMAFDQISGMNRVEFYLNDVFQKAVSGPGPLYNYSFKYHGPVVVKALAIDNAGHRVWKEIKNPEPGIFERFLLDHFPLLHRLLDIWRYHLL